MKREFEDDEPAKLAVPVNNRDHIQGPREARLTLVEYGDYECPACGEAYPMVKTVQSALGNRLRFVFRNFPLTNVHPHAEHAAEAAEAADAARRFWEMHDVLFENQDALDDEDIAQLAMELGLDAREIIAEVETGAHRDRIIQDFRSGVRSGVGGTPTFFINGIRHDGPWDAETLVSELTAKS
ncbi:MAG TPA: DsbA family protein [Verrucomicrobiae bacterium]|nr:DsbA family protein [Verrucomicrobiae bacterium]